MPQVDWYYAQGDVQQGPVSQTQLEALIARGKLRPTDLIWKEGMADWTPAGEVPGLFPAQPPAPPTVEPSPAAASAPQDRAASRRPRFGGLFDFGRPIEPLMYGRQIGQPLLLVGFVLVVLAKGCDAVGNRRVDRLNAKIQVAENRFQDEWDRRRMEIEDRRQAIRERPDRTAEDDRELADLDEQLQELNEQMEDKQRQLRRGRWRDQQIAARDAEANERMWGFWREGVFVCGTIVLSIGLLAVGFTGNRAERWICLTMLAIITFSLYVGGAAWVGSLTVGR